MPIYAVLIGPAGNRGESYGAVIEPSSGFSGSGALVLQAGNVSLATGAIRVTNLVLNGASLSGGSVAGIYAAGYVHATVLAGVRVTGFPGAGIADRGQRRERALLLDAGPGGMRH